ncbi:MAG: sugar-transfer associated ATP-grasp domain-containing protein, partial [Pseudomonadota bacterium]
MKAILRAAALTRGIPPLEAAALRLDEVPVGERRLWLGALEARNLCLRLNAFSHHRGIVSDKLLFGGLLSGLGYPVPRVHAIFGRKTLGVGFRSLATREELADFLAKEAPMPLFGKPLAGERSEDAIRILDRAGDGLLRLPGGEKAAAPALARQIARAHSRWGFLFQEALAQHPALVETVGDTVACLRLVTLQDAEGRAEVIQALWKVPRAGAVADNLWRGGLLAALDG